MAVAAIWLSIGLYEVITTSDANVHEQFVSIQTNIHHFPAAY